jgi:hypothetical protein
MVVIAEASMEPAVLLARVYKDTTSCITADVMARSPENVAPAFKISAVADNTAPLSTVTERVPRLPVKIPEVVKEPVLVPDTAIPLRLALRVEEIAVTATLPAPLIVLPSASAALRVKVPAVTSTLLPLPRELMAELVEEEALTALLPSPIPWAPLPS